MILEQDQQSDFNTTIEDLEIFAKRTYDWAFNKWSKVVWQEFDLNQLKVGGCVFIVRASQSPNNGDSDSWREKKSIWNQAWFSSLRSAYGYRIWGEHWNNQEMIRKAELAKKICFISTTNTWSFSISLPCK